MIGRLRWDQVDAAARRVGGDHSAAGATAAVAASAGAPLVLTGAAARSGAATAARDHHGWHADLRERFGGSASAPGGMDGARCRALGHRRERYARHGRLGGWGCRRTGRGRRRRCDAFEHHRRRARRLGERAICRLATAQRKAQCRNDDGARDRDGESPDRVVEGRCSDFRLHLLDQRFVYVAGFPFGWGERRGVQLEPLIRAIPDFPIPGILFRDIMPLLGDKDGFKAMIDLFVEKYRGADIEYVVGIEARGYMLGAPVAYALGAGFVPVRKPGKLPSEKFTEEYALEYGTNTLEIHADAVTTGKRVLVVDDLLATGGTMAATLRLLARLGATIAGVGVLIELAALNGRKALPGVDVTSFITY